MASRRRGFERPLGERRYRQRFIIAVEGAVTEPQYFAMLDDQQVAIKLKVLKSTSDSAPTHVLQRMRKFLKKEALSGNDEAWLVVDRDSWPEDQLDALWRWTIEKPQRGLALSNPSFELWLLLHFESATGITTKREVVEHLQRFVPDYEKALERRSVFVDGIDGAIVRARSRDVPPCESWPKTFGITTVYRLVEKIRGGERPT